MIDLIERIESFKAEQSLLMSYCVGLPFFEQDVLPVLQKIGEGRVTVLLSESEYESSFADFVKSAGIRYRFHPVRLSHPNQKFHPKLYLLVKPGEARLLIASANLTPSGFRSNLEIADEIGISEAGDGDLQACSQFAQLLRSLVVLDRRLPTAVSRELMEIAKTLDHWVGKGLVSDVGPRLLHSIDEPLLVQLLRIIPPAGIREIVAVSPFFDEHSKGILQIAAAYPQARIRLIKDKEPGALEGSRLSKLKARLFIDEFIAADNENERRLHAKALVFRDLQREWVASGSANLTRAGLLGSAKTGGNVEAVILREYDNHDLSGLLLSGIRTQRVNAKTLSWNPATNIERMPSKGLTIIDAHLKGTQINIAMQTTLPHGELLYRVVAECAGQRSEVSISAKPDSGGSILLQVPVKRAFIQTEDPLSVTVQVQGNGPMARSWVAVPFALAFTAAQRGVQSSARQMCRRVFEDGDAASVVADAIANFLGELANLTEQPGTAVAGGRSAEQREEPDRPVSANDFIVSTEELGNLRETTARTTQAFYGLAALLEKILIVVDTDDEDMPADSIDVEAAEEKPEHQLEDRNEQSRKRDRVKAEDQLSQLTEAFQLTVREALHKEVSPAAVPFVLNLPDAVISFLLLHARIRQHLNLEPDRRLTNAFRDILQDVLSIDGILIGTSFGWLVRAKFSDRCQTTLRELLNDRGRVSRLFAFIAAGLVMAGPNSPDLAQAVLGGLHFVTGEMPASQIDEEIQTQLGRVAAASGGWICVADMEKVLRAYAPGQISALLFAQRWTAKPADSFCLAIERNSIVSCSRSHMTFPANTSVMLKSANGDVRCPFCHRVILPVKTGSIVSGVLHWFDSVLAGTQ